jgi:hypothetical protein
MPVPVRWQEWLKRFTASHEKVDHRQFFWIRVELYGPIQRPTGAPPA